MLQSVDYSKCLCEIRLKKPKFLGSSLKHVYISSHELIICKKPYQKFPDQIINLKDKVQYIIWVQDDNNQVIGFKLYSENNQKIIELYGENIHFIKDYLCKNAFQRNFMDEYFLVKKIGKGKYAKVYKIIHKITYKQFAAKYLHKSKLAQIENGESAFLNELNILRSLDHPNCISLLEVYEDKYGFYIITELLDENRSLLQEVQKKFIQNHPTSTPQKQIILKQLLLALQYLHAKGIMHRDLKPLNIMFSLQSSTKASELKLIDFGLAQYLDQPYIYTHVGTPGFVAPEILNNEQEDLRYDEKCDVFSGGVIFFFILCGIMPFKGNKYSEVLESNKKCEISFDTLELKNVSLEAVDLLQQMLLKDPKQRISVKQALTHQYFSEKEKKGFTINDLDLLSDKKVSNISLVKKISSLQHIQQQKNEQSIENFAIKLVKVLIEIQNNYVYTEINEEFSPQRKQNLGIISPLSAITGTSSTQQQKWKNLVQGMQKVQLENEICEQIEEQNVEEDDQKQGEQIVLDKINKSALFVNTKQLKVQGEKIEINVLKNKQIEQKYVERQLSSGLIQTEISLSEELKQIIKSKPDFPNGLLDSYIQLDYNRIFSEIKEDVYKFGLFILFKNDFQEDQPSIQRKIKEIEATQEYKQPLIELVKQITDKNISHNIDFQQIYSVLIKDSIQE